MALSDSLSYSKTGRISSYNDVSYTYDKLGRLTEAKWTAKDEGSAETATAPAGGIMNGVSAVSYEYDEIGNIISAKTTLSSGKQSIEEYIYDTKNPDQLISYKKDGVEKKIGKYKGLNPGQYDGRTLTWARGRELRSVTAGKNNSSLKQDKNKKKSEDGSSSVGTSDPDPDPVPEASSDDAGQFNNITYEYDYNGVRIAKTVDNKRTEYIINGNRVLSQKTSVAGDKKKKDDKENTASDQYELINFYYSSSGKLLELGYSQNGEKETHYTVITNAVGDVVALYTSDGIPVGTYSYDPYGGITEISRNDNYKDKDGILEKNPFRYRSYYFDTETGWYYLNSRYYDPQVKRFINGDDPSYLGVGDEINSYNLYVYCDGDPVNGNDPAGCFDVSGFAIGTGIALFGVAALMVATAPAWAVVLGVAAVTTGVIMAGTAAIDGVMAMDLSYSRPNMDPIIKKTGYRKEGGSVLLDFENDEAVLYGHIGGGVGAASAGVTYSVGEVFGYTDRNSYKGEFVDFSVANTYGIDCCWAPGGNSASALSATFGSGKTLSCGYDMYTSGKVLFSWWDV